MRPGRELDKDIGLALQDQIGGIAGISLAHDRFADREPGEATMGGDRVQRCSIEMGKGRV